MLQQRHNKDLCVVPPSMRRDACAAHGSPLPPSAPPAHKPGQIRLLLDPDPLSPVLLLNRWLSLSSSTCHQMLLVLQQEASSCTRNPAGLSVVQTKEKQ